MNEAHIIVPFAHLLAFQFLANFAFELPIQGENVSGDGLSLSAWKMFLEPRDHSLTEDQLPPEDSETGSSLDSVFAAEFTPSAWIASARGSLQTPRGGRRGTTSPHRPSVSEIGLDGLQWMPLVDSRLTFFQDHELHVNYAALDIDGRDVLEKTLISQGQTFPAGSIVKSNLQIDLLRIGYRPVWLSWMISSWSLLPGVGVSIDPFRYQLDSRQATGRVNRSYVIAFPYLEVLAAGPLVGPLSLEIDLAGSAGINGATFVDNDLRLVYGLLERGSWQLGLVMGLKGTWLRRRDGQSPVPNDPNLRLGSFSDDPWGGLTLGLRIRF